MIERIASVGDLWLDLPERAVSLRPAVDELQRLRAR